MLTPHCFKENNVKKEEAVFSARFSYLRKLPIKKA
jgi:hypothetical protein